MTEISRREILAALAGIAAVAAMPGAALAAEPAIDLSTGRAIGQAYLAAHPETSLAKLRRLHLPAGLDPTAVGRLRTRVAADFHDGRTFVHEGWRLSQTEAQLFALLGSASRA